MKATKVKTVIKGSARLVSRFISGLCGGWLEWLSALLLLLTLGIAVRCIEQPHWIDPQPSLTLALIFAVMTGFLFARSRLPVIAAWLLAFIAGGAVTLWQVFQLTSTVIEPASLPSWLAGLRSVWQSLSLSQPSESILHFAIFLIIFVWFAGFISAWFVLRSKNAWVAVTLGALAMLVNLRHLTEDYYSFFPFYILAAMLLVIQTNLARQHNRLAHGAGNLRSMAYFMSFVLVFSTVVVGGTWLVPEVRANPLHGVATAPLSWTKTIDSSWLNIFAPVPAKQSTLTSAAQDVLHFSGSVDRRKEVQFIITSPVRPAHWRTLRYDVYHLWGWTVDSTVETASGTGTAAKGTTSGTEFTYTVDNKVKTDILITAGEFTRTNAPVTLNANISDSDSPDIMSITFPRLLDYSESYTATSHIISPSPADLAAAGEEYPPSVRSRYLQLPYGLPRRIAQTSLTVTRQADTPYDKAEAIRNYLLQLTYNEAGTAPPEGTDGVDYFLFNRKTGNCTNFASAMVVMLRSAGVPARLATGYLPRLWDEAKKTSTLRGMDYHAWAEVYFPGFGWIEFEPTPSSGTSEDSEPAVGDTPASVGTTPTPTPSVTGITGNNFTDPLGIPPEEYGVVDDFSFIGDGLQSLSGGQSWLRLLFFAAILAILLLVLRIVRRRWQRRRHTDYSATLYSRLCFMASLLKLRPRPQLTPSEYCAVLTHHFPQQADAIRQIGQTYIASRFSPRKDLNAEERQDLQRSWNTLSRALLKGLFRRRSLTIQTAA